MIPDKEFINNQIIGRKVKDIQIKDVFFGSTQITEAYMILDNDLTINLGTTQLEIIDSEIDLADWKSLGKDIDDCCVTEYKDIKIVDVLYEKYYPFLFWKLENGAIIYFSDYGTYALGPVVMESSRCLYFIDEDVCPYRGEVFRTEEWEEGWDEDWDDDEYDKEILGLK